ncbi:hypothetical protein H0H81_001294 [Sphagnurus paluster]|uniref:Uncharacterized protein n=1 Tax=Sphagnurus paluster TaxID=117069 RepID=A0A9P7FZW9_9AGAR|nr:hypothetical protein H0H81_001294 [Sphagnurus paluster]
MDLDHKDPPGGLPTALRRTNTLTRRIPTSPQTEDEPTQSEVQSLESIEQPPSEVSQHLERKPTGPFSIHVLALLIPFSIFGALARLGLDGLANYQGRAIFPLAYAQGVGCFVMGFVVGLKEPFGRFYPPLYTALTTGFCGSLTTFSGWQLDVFNSWVDAGQYQHGGLRNFVDGVGKSTFTLAISMASISFGLQLGSVMYPFFPSLAPPNQAVCYIITTICILAYAAVFATYFLMDPDFRHQATAALLFAYPGALTRYTLSVLLNTRLQTIPLGTFLANSIGTALLGGFNVLQNKSYPVSPSACSLLQGLLDGYCGCLTTVSTFVVEARGLAMRRGVRYALFIWAWQLAKVPRLEMIGVTNTSFIDIDNV